MADSERANRPASIKLRDRMAMALRSCTRDLEVKKPNEQLALCPSILGWLWPALC